MNNKIGIVLLSGGLDSTTTLAIMREEQGLKVHALSFRYGQRHLIEIEAASTIAHLMGARHHVVDIDMRAIGGSALTSDIQVPENRSEEEMGDGIPDTYVPARNTIFLSFALAYAEVLKASSIFIGVNALDYSGYPDCRPEFIQAFQNLAKVATSSGVEGHELLIRTPLIALNKAEIIRWGNHLGVDYSLTISCYQISPEGLACGRCDSCILRLKGFAENGLQDPAQYVRTK